MAVPAQPANACPASANFRQFLLSLATYCGEIDNCIRGFYASSDIIGGNHVLYMSEATVVAAAAADPAEELEPNMPCWCSPCQECYGRITMPQPTDTNFLVCIMSSIG